MTGWWTFGLQIVNFLALVWLLRRFLYRPVLATLADRRKRTEEANAQVASAQASAEQARVALDAARLGVDAERQRTLADAHVRAESERAEVLARAAAEAEAIVTSGRRILDEERRAALGGLQHHVTELATAMAARALSELGSPAIDDAFLERTDAHLAALPADRRRALGGEGVEVVTAHALAPDAAVRWSDHLRRHLGSDTRVSFASDPSLIAGVELRFRSAVVQVSWRGMLDDAEHAIGDHALAG